VCAADSCGRVAHVAALVAPLIALVSFVALAPLNAPPVALMIALPITSSLLARSAGRNSGGPSPALPGVCQCARFQLQLGRSFEVASVARSCAKHTCGGDARTTNEQARGGVGSDRCRAATEEGCIDVVDVL
jgi:hypothetical protein